MKKYVCLVMALVSVCSASAFASSLKNTCEPEVCNLNITACTSGINQLTNDTKQNSTGNVNVSEEQTKKDEKKKRRLTSDYKLSFEDVLSSLPSSMSLEDIAKLVKVIK